jgi:hypothetical protein
VVDSQLGRTDDNFSGSVFRKYGALSASEPSLQRGPRLGYCEFVLLADCFRKCKLDGKAGPSRSCRCAALEYQTVASGERGCNKRLNNAGLVAKATQTTLMKLTKCCTISYTIEFESAAAKPICRKHSGTINLASGVDQQRVGSMCTRQDEIGHGKPEQGSHTLRQRVWNNLINTRPSLGQNFACVLRLPTEPTWPSISSWK